MTTTTIDIDRPAQQVYAYVTDPTQFHEWQEGVVSGGLKEPGPAAVGSHCQMVRRIGGADRPSTSIVTKLDPPTTWAVRGVDGPIRAQVDVTVQPSMRPLAGRHRRRLRGLRHRQDPRPTRRTTPGSQGDAREPAAPQGPAGGPTRAADLTSRRRCHASERVEAHDRTAPSALPRARCRSSRCPTSPA